MHTYAGRQKLVAYTYLFCGETSSGTMKLASSKMFRTIVRSRSSQ